MADKNYGSLPVVDEKSATLELQKPGGFRSQLERWLVSDHSSRNLSSNSTNSEQSWRSSNIFGPTDRTVQSRVEDHSRPGLQYKSVDRGLADTAVWHRRKVHLLKRRGKDVVKTVPNKNADALLSAPSMDSTGSDADIAGGHKYDAKTVSRLQSERLLFDKVIIIFIGIAMAFTGVIVSRVADTILDKKIETALETFQHDGFNAGMAIHVGLSALLALGAFIPVAFCPVSAGSGIAEAKATLNGVVIPECTSLLTALCKGLSVIMSVSASLPAGLEGPMIHLGLCIGALANNLVPSKYQVLDFLRTDRMKIDYTAIGTAAGVAAAFRTPISGILFTMEEGASYWSTNLAWRCFLSACVCVITIYAIVSSSNLSFHITSMDLFNGIDDVQKTNGFPVIPATFVPSFKLWEYALFLVAGAGGGLIGAIFCMVNRAIALERRRVSMSMGKKALEVVCIAATYASLIWVMPSLPFLSRCGNLDERSMDASYFRRFNCPEGQYNELATLLLNIGGKGITLLFQEADEAAFSITTCLAAGTVQVVTLVIAFGISVSAGIFIPLLFIGSCYGRSMALVLGLDPRTYAIVGAAACLGGVVRVLISLTAIVTSTTSLSFFMTPIMLATLSAQMVGNAVSGMPGIYDIILQLRGVPFLEELCPEGAGHTNIRARNIMKTGLVTLGTQVRVGELVEILMMHSYSEFPVVDRDADGEGGGCLVGSVSRVDLCALLSRPDIFFTHEGVTKKLSYAELDTARPRPLPSQEDIGKHLTLAEEDMIIHLSPYIQIAPHTVGGHASAERAYEMFRCLGLRILLVVDKKRHPIGIITRHELILLEELGHDHQVIKTKRKRATMYTQHISSLGNQFE